MGLTDTGWMDGWNASSHFYCSLFFFSVSMPSMIPIYTNCCICIYKGGVGFGELMVGFSLHILTLFVLLFFEAVELLRHNDRYPER